MTESSTIVKHYARPNLAADILKHVGKDRPEAMDFSFCDEFHIGGRRATEYLAGKLEIAKGMRVLDIGSGLGGPARTIAALTGAHVTGIDLTPDYVAAAEALSDACGLSGLTEFKVGDACDLPFDDGAFPAAYTIHVAMNIADKARFYAETARVVAPGGMFGLYDILGGGFMKYPLPWAPSSQCSHLVTIDELRGMLEDAGFEILEAESRHELALAALARAGQGGGPQLVLGPDWEIRMNNLFDCLMEGHCAPWQVICRRLECIRHSG